MASIWEHNRLYSILRPWVDAATRTSFSSLRTEGLENIPEDAAVILSLNHTCTLMDPLVVLQCFKGPVAFGARADIFRRPAVARILRFLRMVPLSRARDGYGEVAKNAMVFDEIVDCIGHGVPFCLCPEGKHRPERGLQPLKKGIFRIAELAAETLDRPVFIVPVCITYEDFFCYMKRTVVVFGKPVPASEFAHLSPSGKTELLSERMLDLLRYEEMDKKESNGTARKALSIISLPIFALCALLASPVLIPEYFLCRKLRDKAWLNTVRYACSLLLVPLWPFHRAFHLLLNLWKNR